MFFAFKGRLAILEETDLMANQDKQERMGNLEHQVYLVIEDKMELLDVTGILALMD